MANLRVAIDKVAPPAGAWIETENGRCAGCICAWSRPPRARGLKLKIRLIAQTVPLSRPPRARGLKRAHGGFFFPADGVAPPAGAWIETWECITERGGAVASRPPRARGLKLQQGCGPMSMCRVASRAGRVD